MSLLLEALKKAELAKQMAKAESAPAGSPQEAAKPVMTREKLPDISQPLEILTDDLPSSEQNAAIPKAARTELSLEGTGPSAVAEQQGVFAPGASQAADNRVPTEQLFQVREMDYNPRRPFYVTLAALAFVGVGYGGYVWWQLRPPASFGARQPARTAPTAVVSVAPVTSAAPSLPPAATPPQASATDIARAGVQKAVQPPVESIPPIRPARPVASAPSKAMSGHRVREQAPAGRRLAAQAPSPQRESPTESSAPISIKPPKLVVDPLIERAYQAYQKDDLLTAQETYEQILAREPNNRDALLGLAAIDLRMGNVETAAARYTRLLELDPRDPYAIAGLTALRGQLDPVRSESRLKTLIANEPDATRLYFALGNEYARQARWSDAEAAYFKAYSADPENADYAFNLAVSLDQLRQKEPALEYYRRALALAKTRAASFSRDQAQARVAELSR